MSPPAARRDVAPDAHPSHPLPFEGDDDACGLRERKKRMTRRAIHQAALTLVAEHGLDAVTTDAIAAAADVSPRTFFNYFPTKDAAVLGIPPDLTQRLSDALVARPESEDLFTALTAVMRGWFIKVDGDPLRGLRGSVVRQDDRLAAAMIGTNREIETALVDAALRRPGAGDGLEARVMVAAVIGAARATYLHTQSAAGSSGSSAAFAQALDGAFDLLRGGFGCRTH